MTLFMPAPYVVTNSIVVTAGTADLTVADLTSEFGEAYGFGFDGTLSQNSPELISTNLGSTTYAGIYTEVGVGNFAEFNFATADEATAVLDYIQANFTNLITQDGTTFSVATADFTGGGGLVFLSGASGLTFTAGDVDKIYTMEWL